MKPRFAVMAAPLAAWLLLSLTGCRNGPSWDAFDPRTEGVVDVVVEMRPSIMSAREAARTGWFALADGGRIRPVAPFETDPMAAYDAPPGCFESDIDRARNAIVNRLVRMELRDADGNEAPVDAQRARVLRRVAGLEHDLLAVRLLETGGETFVYVELNVNLWSPCVLYWYDGEADRLVELCKWDACEVVGLRVRNIALARKNGAEP